MKNKMIVVFTLLLLIGLGLSWRYLLQQLEPSAELKLNQNTVEHLTEFEELKELFSQEVMRLSSGLERTFDPTNIAFKTMKQEQAILNKLSQQGATALAVHMNDINAMVDELENIFEGYKSNHALAANSAIYVPSLYRQTRDLLNNTLSPECIAIRPKLNSWLDAELSNVLFMYSDQPQRRSLLPLKNACLETNQQLSSLFVSLDNHINVFYLTRESNSEDVVSLTDASLEYLLVDIKLKNIKQLAELAHQQDRQLRSFYVVLSLFVLALVISVSMAVNYYRKNRINQQRSLTDPLTGIGNRLSFDQDLQSLVEQYRLGGNAFSLFYIDLDNFKSVNDNLSHDDGDRLLINITTELTQILRSVDHLYRIGGDEFILLSQSRTDRVALSTIAKKLIRCCSQSVPYGQGRFIEVSASVGVVVMRADIIDVKMLIQEADIAMYQVKNEGKGNFVFAEDAKEQAETNQPA